MTQSLASIFRTPRLPGRSPSPHACFSRVGRSCLWPTAALVVMWSVLASMTQAATLEVYGPITAKQVVQLSGLIGPDDGRRLTGLVKDSVEAGRLVPSLSLDSLGGTFGA